MTIIMFLENIYFNVKIYNVCLKNGIIKTVLSTIDPFFILFKKKIKITVICCYCYIMCNNKNYQIII